MFVQNWNSQPDPAVRDLSLGTARPAVYQRAGATNNSYLSVHNSYLSVRTTV